VKGYADLLLTGEGGDLTDQQRLFIEAIARNSSRLERLVGDLLVAAQVEAGSFAIEADRLIWAESSPNQSTQPSHERRRRGSS